MKSKTIYRRTGPIQSVGFKNETEIKDFLNGKRYKDLPTKWRNHIYAMCPEVKKMTKIKVSYVTDHLAKPDLIFTINKKDYYVSIKSGANPSMHQEYWGRFFSFLKNIGIDSNDIQFLKLYQFGETQKTRSNHEPVYTKDEITTKFRPYLDRFNSHMISEEQLLKIINRTVIQGADPTRPKVDFLYYGNVEHGFIWNREEIIDNALQDIGLIGENIPPHFGKLNYQPSGRKIDSDDRNYCRIKWPFLSKLYYQIGTDIYDED